MQNAIAINPRGSGDPALIIMSGLSEFLCGGSELHNLYLRAVTAPKFFADCESEGTIAGCYNLAD